MGYSNELSIELHNDAMANDPDYAAEFMAWQADLDAHLLESEFDETQVDWFPEYSLSFDGYEEFDLCPLCYKPSDSFYGAHKFCMDAEQAWADMSADDLPF